MKKWMTAGVLVCLSLSPGQAQDQYPQLETLDGKVYQQVKVMKVSPAELRVMHAGGFATLPLSVLPPEVRAKYGEVDAAAEAMQAEQRKQGNAAAALMQRQEREAMHLVNITSQPFAVLKQAVQMRDWCLLNPSGGVMNGTTYDRAARDAQLAEANRILSHRPAADVPAPPAPGMVPETASGSPTPTSASQTVVFTPGVIELVSARYTLPGNQPRNVKNRLQRLIPASEITAPVSILVTDALSDAAKNQGETTSSVGVVVTEKVDKNTTVGVAVVETQETPKNMLTVKYTFNGQTYEKQALEGGYLVLP